ncbi:putative ABI family protein [Helianthus anomalus]
MEAVNDFHPPSNYDEIFMQRRLIFSDSLQDLRKVRSQLYSAAEFFEDSYHKTEHDPLLLESLKDYVSKALISTIDHLGSVTSKVNSFLDENIDEAYETNLRVVCIKQRLQTCQTFSDHEGLSQQSLVITTPKYHKQYLLPDGQFPEAAKAKTESFTLRRERNKRDLKEFGSDLVDFTFAKAASNKGSEKRSRSVSPSRFRIKRSGSLANPSASPVSLVGYPGSVINRSFSPNTQLKHQAEARRSYSLYLEKERRQDIQVYSKKTRNLFKALLSIHKNKNDSR